MRNAASLRIRVRRAALVLTALASSLILLVHSAAQAQSFIRSPNLNIESRVPSINTTPRINPNIAGAVARTANALDPASRTLLVEVHVPNGDGALLPGRSRYRW